LNGELSALHIIVDGQIAQTIKISGRSFSNELPEDSIPNGRWVNFVAEDKNGLRSTVRAFFLGTTPYKGKLNILAFGANHFNGAVYGGQSVPDLSFAASDAERFVLGLQQFVAPSYVSYQVIPNDGDKVTKEGLLAELTKLASDTGKDDTLVLFFASHGMTTKEGFSLLLPSNEPHSSPVELPFSLISAALQKSRGRIFVFLDACHSAGATQEVGSDQLASSTDRNITIITASKGQQSSLENAAWGGGAFTSAVLATLPNSSGTIFGQRVPLNVESFYANVRKAVATQTHGQGTPWLRPPVGLGLQSIN